LKTSHFINEIALKRGNPGLKYTSLDRKDLDIIEALDKFGSKVSAEQLSDHLNIPSRTVRYRLAKLKSRGFLKPIRAITHERKIGLGENMIFVQELENRKISLLPLFQTIPYFSMVKNTYGKFNGYLIHSFYSLTTPTMNLLLMEQMKQSELISDYLIFDMKYFKYKNINLNHFNPEDGWKWDCDSWVKQIPNFIHQKQKSIPGVEKKHSKIDFDNKDVLILRTLRNQGDVTLKNLGKLLDLSESQVGKRIRRLQEEQVIIKYHSSFIPMSREEIIVFYLFLELKENTPGVLSAIKEIPNQLFINMESSKKVCIITWLSIKGFNCFLRGLDYFKPYLKSYFFQFTEPSSIFRCEKVYDLYNLEKKRWETPPEPYLDVITKFAHS
jgi:DNA-binding Lrp family transcriptional regulator